MGKTRSKILAILVAMTLVVSMFAMAAPAMAVKPSTNLAAAQHVDWNLSADVMPVPPYGSLDIPGSDVASKLIVNQPNGNTEVAMTGVMNGLMPLTQYTVFLSKSYVPYVETGWSVIGDWNLRFMYGGAYDHFLDVTSQDADGFFQGTGYYLNNPAITWTVQGASQVVGDTVILDLKYDGSTYYVHAEGTIDPTTGGIVDGTWGNATQSGTWSSTSGAAVMTHTGSTGWPGLFTTTVQPFTFMTDEYGCGSWHLNLRDENFPGTGAYTLSVWVNVGGRTILISDNFTVVK